MRICWTLLAALLMASTAHALEPKDVVETATRIDSRKLDTHRSLPATGQTLERPGLTVTFVEGGFTPVVRDDGRISGLLFSGLGQARAQLPDAVEGRSWEVGSDHAAQDFDFDAAYLRFTDGTLLDLQGDAEFAEASDTGGALWRMFEARQGLLERQNWIWMHPNLSVDTLADLVDGRHVGGHLYADFRRINGGPAPWVSYLHNPRGALIANETTAWFRVATVGGAPPEVAILSSWGQSEWSGKQYDVANIRLDVTFPTLTPLDVNLVDANVKASLDLVNTSGHPLRSLVFELAPRRDLCTGQSDNKTLRIKAARDAAGTKLAAVHRGDRLLVALDKPLAPGDTTTLQIDYGGAMTQGVPSGQPDVYFSEIGPWAWYPRNPHLDRHGSRVSVHLPRFMRGVAPGRLIEEREEKDGWHYTYEEPSGVRNLTLAVGDFVKTPVSRRGESPEVIAWVGSPQQEYLRTSEQSARGALSFIESIWGPYPYSTLHVVENLAYPSMNWNAEDASGSAWSCVPPGVVHPWQGFVDGPSGMLLSAYPTTSPARTVVDGKNIDRLLVNQMDSGGYALTSDLTRQWWGHMVPARTDRDVWVNEAIAHWTALLWAQNKGGKPALKERVRTMHNLMVEEGPDAQPLSRGELMGAGLPVQAWARGPLVINWLVDRMRAKPFSTAMGRLMNQAAARGITGELLFEVVASASDDETAAMLQHAVEDVRLPELGYGTAIDKASGTVVVVFEHLAEPYPVDVRVEAVAGPKAREQKTFRVGSEGAVARWTPEDPPKRVLIDPLKAALAASVTKKKELQQRAEQLLQEALEAAEQDESAQGE